MEPLSTTPRAYSAAHFALKIDGYQDIGLFRSIEGGGMKVEAMTYQTGGTPSIQRFPGKPKFEDFKVTTGMAMSLGFYVWLKRFFAGTINPQNGEIVAADFHYNVRARRRFTGAIITDCTFPKLDNLDKSAANLTVSIAPETMEFLRPGGSEKLQHPEQSLAQKLWAACNFEFVIDGMDAVSQHVSKVDALTIKQKAIEYHVGAERHPSKVPGRIELPNLSFYVPEAHAGELLQKAHKRGFKGTVDGTAPLSGHITTYSNDRTPVFEVGFKGGEIVSMQIDKSDAGSEEIKQVKFEMAIQSLSFSHKENEASLQKLDVAFD